MIDKCDNVRYIDTMTRTDHVREVLKAKTGRRASMRQISREAGVTLSTISRFIDGKPTLSETVDKLAAWIENDDEEVASRV